MIDLWVYDFEVFPQDWIVTFNNVETNEEKTFHNDFVGVKNFYEEKIENKAVLIGYNSKFYDDHILRAVLNNIDPYLLSDWIINQKQSPWTFGPLKFKKNSIISYDVMGNIARGDHRVPLSLKQIEGYMGWKIFECDVPWYLDRPLNDYELKKVIEYNLYDVTATKKIFKKFHSFFSSHMALVEMFDMEPKKLNVSGASKTALVLQATPIEKYESFSYNPPERVRKLLANDIDILSKFTELVIPTDREKRKNLSFRFSKKMNDFDFDFGLGGGHGAINNFQYEGEIWNLDVKSYYVSLMVEYNLITRACDNGVEKLKEILRKRVECKAAGKTEFSEGLKMVLVAIYGSMAYENSAMWDPEKQTSVCITGQLLLYLLQKNLEPYAKIVQVNTDGIIIIPHNKQKCEEIYKQWEKDTGMELELDVGYKIVQKDVNNYIYAKAPLDELRNNWDKNISKIKTKGSGVRLFNLNLDRDDFEAKANYTVNNNMTIIDIAVVKYFLLQKPLRETIISCNELVRFQRVVKLLSNYTNITINTENSFEKLKNKNIMDYNGDNPEEETIGKCYRFFAVTKDGYWFKKYKEIEKDGEQTFKNDSIPNFSKSMVIVNDDLKNLKTDYLSLDYDYYVNFAQKIVDMYEHGDDVIDESNFN